MGKKRHTKIHKIRTDNFEKKEVWNAIQKKEIKKRKVSVHWYLYE